MRGGSRALAQLHNILEKYPLPSDIEVESLHEKAQRKCAQIVKLKNYILRHSKTNAFEHLFYECYERFLEQGQKSAEILCELENSKTSVPIYCHGAFNQHNVVYTQNKLKFEDSYTIYKILSLSFKRVSKDIDIVDKSLSSLSSLYVITMSVLTIIKNVYKLPSSLTKIDSEITAAIGIFSQLNVEDLYPIQHISVLGIPAHHSHCLLLSLTDSR